MTSSVPGPAMTRRAIHRAPLARPRTCVLGGVSVALADHLDWPVGVVRWLFVGTALLGGAGVLFYLWLWALVPLRDPGPGEPDDRVRRRVNVSWSLAAVGSAAAVVSVVLAAAGVPGAGLGALLAAVVLLVAAVAWDQFVEEDAQLPSPLSAAAFRTACGALLVVVALLVAILQSASGSGPVWLGIIAATFAGAAVMVAPWALRLWQELIGERTARIREEQRAEMAAHLHDSVLQTLALIQNRAGASSEVGRLARAQERELRDWLYADAAHSDRVGGGDLASELRDAAAALEAEYPVRFDIVAVGDPVGGFPAELGGAAREAMLNAARHAGGDVSVYIENGRDATDLYVRDRGPGFELEAIPEGRLGVRESILGRMRRIGGQATVDSGETGTEVHLRVVRAVEAQ